MTLLREIISIKFEEGGNPGQWPSVLRSFSSTLLTLFIAPCYYLAAVLQSPVGINLLRGQEEWRSSVSYIGIAFLLLLGFLGAFLTYRFRIFGLLIAIASVCYVGPIVAVTLIAMVLTDSMALRIMTFLLVMWSSLTLIRVNAWVTTERVQNVAMTRLKRFGQDTYILGSAGSDKGESVSAALSGSVTIWTKIAECGGAAVFILIAPALIPVGIASEAAQGGPLLTAIWFACISVFLVCRSQINIFFVLIRAALLMSHSQDDGSRKSTNAEQS